MSTSSMIAQPISPSIVPPAKHPPRSPWKERLRKFFQRPDIRRTPTLLQMEAVECGAAALGMILGYYKRIVPLAELLGLRHQN